MDNLTLIKGIGPVYAAKLVAAGIKTFKLLAAATDEHLLLVCEVKSWQKVDVNGWREQAAHNPQAQEPDYDLMLVTGIGLTYAERLVENGIATLEYLAVSTGDEIRAALGLQKWQAAWNKVADWIKQADQLAMAAR